MFNPIKSLADGSSVALSTTATAVLTKNIKRGSAIIQNLDAAIVARVGPSGVSSSGGGVRLAAGETWLCLNSDLLYAASASGTPNLGITQESHFANPVRRLTYDLKTVVGSRSLISPKDFAKVRTTVQNLNGAALILWVGNENILYGSLGVKLAPNARFDFIGAAALWAIGLAVNEVQTVTIDAAGGTFTLTFVGQVTAPIAFDAAASLVKTRLEALSTIGAGNVNVTGSAGGPYSVTFQGTLADTNVAQMTGSAVSLTGGASTVTIATLTPGGSTSISVGVTTQLT